MSLRNILTTDLFLSNNGMVIFSRTEKNAIFISQQTHLGLKITANLITRGNNIFTIKSDTF